MKKLLVQLSVLMALSLAQNVNAVSELPVLQNSNSNSNVNANIVRELPETKKEDIRVSLSYLTKKMQVQSARQNTLYQTLPDVKSFILNGADLSIEKSLSNFRIGLELDWASSSAVTSNQYQTYLAYRLDWDDSSLSFTPSVALIMERDSYYGIPAKSVFGYGIQTIVAYDISDSFGLSFTPRFRHTRFSASDFEFGLNISPLTNKDHKLIASYISTKNPDKDENRLQNYNAIKLGIQTQF